MKYLKLIWFWLTFPLRKIDEDYFNRVRVAYDLDLVEPRQRLKSFIGYIERLDNEVPHPHNKKCIEFIKKAEDMLRLRDECRIRRGVKGTTNI